VELHHASHEDQEEEDGDEDQDVLEDPLVP